MLSYDEYTAAVQKIKAVRDRCFDQGSTLAEDEYDDYESIFFERLLGERDNETLDMVIQQLDDHLVYLNNLELAKRIENKNIKVPKMHCWLCDTKAQPACIANDHPIMPNEER